MEVIGDEEQDRHVQVGHHRVGREGDDEPHESRGQEHGDRRAEEDPEVRPAGETFSLVNSLTMSAAGCKSPRGPTRFGP